MNQVAQEPLTQILEHSPRLAERTRLSSTRYQPIDGEFVLYWVRHAMRAHENPALDVAISLSNRWNKPLLVYQSTPQRYPYASDRHHAFMLQGARDLQLELRARKIAYAFHLPRRGQALSPLRDLAARAVGIVTEEMPVEPLRDLTTRLAEATGKPLFTVDTACVVPMLLVERAHERAFEYRQATRRLYRERLHLPWDEQTIELPQPKITLPFESIDLSSADLSELIGQCEIDHTVPPSSQNHGGSVAGYARWEDFKSHGLKRYADRRNNPLLAGTSRLSPYLHYGMVSPLRVAREAAEIGGAGTDKFLDELLIWRELAYSFCFYRSDVDSLAAIPSWAQQTLKEHREDPRVDVKSWETLARGRSGDVLWDIAQRSLLLGGELHNNVRMTWGKGILQWTSDAASALQTMIDLNHRFALDGCDPASYGGLLWCLGQFDRPFFPPQPISGTVRARSTRDHATRLDTTRYRQQIDGAQTNMRIAVIGAGISGLVCARTLADQQLEVQVFEKSRGVGGRMATRRTETSGRFDHGAQYFTIRDPRCEKYLQSWLHDGLVAPWHGTVATLCNGAHEIRDPESVRYVCVPTMNEVCRHLAKELAIEFQVRVDRLERVENHWRLHDDHGNQLGDFDAVLISAPAPQTAVLLAGCDAMQQKASSVDMASCIALMISFDRSLEVPYDAAFVQQSSLSWIARNNSKPGRDACPENWVLHASAQWSESHVDEDPSSLAAPLTKAFWQAIGLAPLPESSLAVHRWRYALPSTTLDERCLYDAEMKIGACGDWCGGPRVEGALLSGMALAGRVLTSARISG